MIAIRLTVPIACWRLGSAREYLESYEIPPPSTTYGALLSLVGEEDRNRHRGCRVTAGLIDAEPSTSIVLRTLWRLKDRPTPLGNRENARPDFQELRVRNDLVAWIDSTDETGDITLEERVLVAFQDPSSVDRFGGLALGESTHLVNDLWLLSDSRPPVTCRAFLVRPNGAVTVPVWVDHVGSAGTRFAVGEYVDVSEAPHAVELPVIG